MTQDNDWIYTNRVPFGLLTTDEQEQLKAHHGNYELFWGNENGWADAVLNPKFEKDIVYRAVRPALVMPSIDWNEVSEGWDWLVITSRDDGVLCSNQPVAKNFDWQFDGYKATLASAFKSFERGNVPAEQWRDSLVTRPEGA